MSDDTQSVDSQSQELAATPNPAHESAAGPASGSDAVQCRREEILHKLELMAGLVAAGLLTTQKANAMRAAYATVLSNLADEPPVASAVIRNEDLSKILKQAPETLALLRPFLTAEQIAYIVDNAAHD